MQHSNDAHFAVGRILPPNHENPMDYSLGLSAIFDKNVTQR